MKECPICKQQTSNPVFCSLSCSSKYNSMIKKELVVFISKHCERCKTPFEIRKTDSVKKFCSRSCAAKTNNTKRSRHKIKECRCCSKEFIGKKQYCSPKCKSDGLILDWLDGKIDGGNKYTISSWARRYVLEQAEYRCEECGENRTRKDGSTILQIDHIDGDWRNNSRENLRCLCPTCHALTDTYGAKNMGNGRAWKKKYNQFNTIMPL